MLTSCMMNSPFLIASVHFSTTIWCSINPIVYLYIQLLQQCSWVDTVNCSFNLYGCCGTSHPQEAIWLVTSQGMTLLTSTQRAHTLCAGTVRWGSCLTNNLKAFFSLLRSFLCLLTTYRLLFSPLLPVKCIMSPWTCP